MENSVIKKLKLNNDQSNFILNLPEEFSELLNKNKINFSERPNEKINFILVFVKSKDELDNITRNLTEIIHSAEYVWFAYPKKSSKKYKCDISRDNGWEILGNLGHEVVSQISIDEDWSALRFRKADQIKNFSRSFALSEKGKERIAKRKSE